MSTEPKLSFKQQQLIVRENAIVDATNNLLAKKGFEMMTMDEVAAEVGIAKASLYKHFPSKEALAAAAMIRLLENTLAFVRGLSSEQAALDQLKSVLQWALEIRMKGGLPTLPTENTSLRETLLNNTRYISRLMDLNELMGQTIERAKSDGAIRKDLPTEVVLFTIYSRSCDPTLDYLRMGDQYSEDQVIEFLMSTCFNGLQ
ncbi:MAG: TetR/AcrR family transcriptional regulator [Burkholderiaceae bacterium]|jgi:AcrR family transcriptional regulator|nr:TetR/AcrR family transcriptional regulator [Polynucleobacter sp.]MCF8189320.1 TetR/AcrR family transcriptional regulator [Sulfuritalea sp.]